MARSKKDTTIVLPENFNYDVIHSTGSNALESGPVVGANAYAYTALRPVVVLYNEDSEHLKDFAERISSNFTDGAIIRMSDKEARAYKNGDIVIIPLKT